MAGNDNLHMSKSGKQDEFYTQLSTIEDELKHYGPFFKDKVVFCNCDDPTWSNFWKFFQLNFYFLGLKKLISTHYEPNGKSYKLEIVATSQGDQLTIPDYIQTPLEGNGDFRSDECLALLDEADIVVTNPPFSLSKEYIPTMMNSGKKFIVLGNINHVTFKEIFHYIYNHQLWLGYNSGHFWFRVPDDYEEKATDFKIDENGVKWRRMGNICWYTNFDIEVRHQPLLPYKTYTPEAYPKYDNYDAIHIEKVEDIPVDYYGIMAVPITYLASHCEEQFEILGKFDGGSASNPLDLAKPILNGKAKYKRIAIRRKVDENGNKTC